MNQNKVIAESIRSFKTDINAEVILADLLDMGFTFDSFLIKHDGLFKRNYSKDILDAYFDVVKSFLVLHISRDSLYDSLPHGLFHRMILAFAPGKRKREFEELKIEEMNARKFFLPFDTEFFLQYIELENELRAYFKNPGKFLQDLLIIQKEIPREYAVKITTYLLFGDKIIGNINHTAQLLSLLIDEIVTYEKKQLCIPMESYPEKNDLSSYSSNENTLGLNTITGKTVDECVSLWEFKIDLEDDSNIEKFIQGKKSSLLHVIECFFDYFIPYEVKYKTRINCIKSSTFRIGPGNEINSEDLNENIDKVYLGFNSTI